MISDRKNTNMIARMVNTFFFIRENRSRSILNVYNALSMETRSQYVDSHSSVDYSPQYTRGGRNLRTQFLTAEATLYLALVLILPSSIPQVKHLMCVDAIDSMVSPTFGQPVASPQAVPSPKLFCESPIFRHFPNRDHGLCIHEVPDYSS